MDLYKKLKLKPCRSEPDVWISRLAIYEDIAAKPLTAIRDIPLKRGLNIIWAEEPEDDNSTAEITGHSAGKTTFCRLLRYILGKTTFGSRVAMELIRKTIPNGYVAAEIHVRGTKWAVRRPFGSGRMSYAKQNATIEDVLQERTGALSQEEYPKTLGLEGLLDNLATGQIVQTAEDIRWAHILAWCTRDQEARFQNIYDWRSPRSESDTPAFRFPKAGPLFVMRAVLGLFLPDELKGEERLAELQRQKEQLEKDIEEKRREPQWRVNLYDQQLRQRLQSLMPEETDIDTRPFRSTVLIPEDLERLTDRAVKQLREDIDGPDGLNSEYESIQARIDSLGGEIARYEQQVKQQDALFGLNAAAGAELDRGLTQRQKQRNDIGEMEDKTCPLGGVLIRECTHVRDRQRILQVTQLQDAHAMEQAEARREEERQKIAKEKAQLQVTIEELKREKQGLLIQRSSILADIRSKQEELRELERTRVGLDTWTKYRDEPGRNEELQKLRKQLDTTEGEIAKAEKALGELLRQHDENRERLASIFSGAVRSVLSSDSYDGSVSLDNRELAFRITHGPAMSGEAVETLAVLLADVASLVYYTVSDKAHLPGFVVHDSPREADLGIRIYRNFIRLIASLESHFQPEKCPFQYFLTTTTPPPKELQGEPYVKLNLNAAQPLGLLLKRSTASAQNTAPTLHQEGS